MPHDGKKRPSSKPVRDAIKAALEISRPVSQTLITGDVLFTNSDEDDGAHDGSLADAEMKTSSSSASNTGEQASRSRPSSRAFSETPNEFESSKKQRRGNASISLEDGEDGKPSGAVSKPPKRRSNSKDVRGKKPANKGESSTSSTSFSINSTPILQLPPVPPPSPPAPSPSSPPAPAAASHAPAQMLRFLSTYSFDPSLVRPVYSEPTPATSLPPNLPGSPAVAGYVVDMPIGQTLAVCGAARLCVVAGTVTVGGLRASAPPGGPCTDKQEGFRILSMEAYQDGGTNGSTCMSSAASAQWIPCTKPVHIYAPI